MSDTLNRLAQYIWLEGDLLDGPDYESWLKLWTADGKYIIPAHDDADADHANLLNYAYDDADMRRMRVARLTSGMSMSASAASSTLRTISRFRLLESPMAGEHVVRCAQNLVEYRAEKHRIYAANVRYTLVEADDGLMLKEKVVQLINASGALAGMTFLL